MIIFDFDGVLIDSVDEVLVTAYNTLRQSLVTTIDELPSAYVRLFRTFRYHVQPASDIIALADWCLTQADNAERSNADRATLSRDEFQNILASYPLNATERRVRFFAERDKIIQQSPSAWLQLNRPYTPLWSSLVHYAEQRPIIILTHKNQRAVVDICKHFGLPVAAENVFSGDRGASKIDNLLSIHKRFGTGEQIFIDDNVHNLIEVRTGFPKLATLHLALASWGYVGEQEAELASARGFLVLNQEGLIERLEHRGG